jgi:hypothetical protein
VEGVGVREPQLEQLANLARAIASRLWWYTEADRSQILRHIYDGLRSDPEFAEDGEELERMCTEILNVALQHIDNNVGRA